MEVTTVQLSYENMQFLTREAISVARKHHIDSCLQVCFSLCFHLLCIGLCHKFSCLHRQAFAFAHENDQTPGRLQLHNTLLHGHDESIEAAAVRYSCGLLVQALFVLGDIALVTYDLPEAQRILSIVALAAADGQVCIGVHYNACSSWICLVIVHV
jgi:hypothetical protein